jgi:hypothetical protein
MQGSVALHQETLYGSYPSWKISFFEFLKNYPGINQQLLLPLKTILAYSDDKKYSLSGCSSLMILFITLHVHGEYTVGGKRKE